MTEGKLGRIDFLSFKLIFNLFDNKYFLLKHKLFSLLHIKEEDYELFNHPSFYEARKYKFNLEISTKPKEIALREDGKDYTIIELSGDACEYIRSENGSILEIMNFLDEINNSSLYQHKYDFIISDIVYNSPDFKYIEKLSCEVTRFDICVDILDNPYFSFEELKKKINNKCYQSSFRANKKFDDSKAHKINESYFANMDSNSLDKINLKDTNLGYSIKFGNLPNLCLNIYDKKAEVLAKQNANLPFNELIRYEFRFGSNKANMYAPLLKKYLVNNNLESYIGSLLFKTLRILKTNDSKLIDSYRDNRILSRLPTWKQWELFVSKLCNDKIDDITIKEKHNLPLRDPVVKKYDWMLSSVYHAITSMSLLTDNDLIISMIMKDCIIKSFKKGKLTSLFNEELNEFSKILNVSELSFIDRLILARNKYISYGGSYSEFKLNKIEYDTSYKTIFENQYRRNPKCLNDLLTFIDGKLSVTERDELICDFENIDNEDIEHSFEYFD